MHADNRGVDHLDSGIVGSSKCVYDAAPDTSPPPTDEAVVACGVRTKHLGQITPRCSRSQDPEDAIKDTTVVNSRNTTRFVRQHGLNGNPFIIGEFVTHDSSPQFGSLNHRDLARRNAFEQGRLDPYAVEANVSQPTISAEAVENDPFRPFIERSGRSSCYSIATPVLNIIFPSCPPARRQRPSQ